MESIQNPASTHRHLSVPAQTGQLKVVRDAVQEVASTLFGGQAHLAVLAVDEALANVICHGATPDGIEIDIDAMDFKFEVRIVDGGPEYDPCLAPSPSPEERTFSMKRGGMGLGIMRRVMDEIHYERLPNQHNELRLIKYVSK